MTTHPSNSRGAASGQTDGGFTAEAARNKTIKLQAILTRANAAAPISPAPITTASQAAAPRRVTYTIVAMAMALVALVAILVGKHHARDPEDARAAAPTVQPSRVTQVDTREPPGVLQMTGHFIARRMARLTTTVIGRVKHIAVDEGDEIAEGAVLIELDAVGTRAELQALEARLHAQELQARGEQVAAAQADNDLSQQGQLRSGGFISRQTLERTQLAAEQGRLRVDIAQAQLDDLRKSLEAARQREQEYIIRAPFAGKVTSIVAAVGEVVAPGGYDTRYAVTGLLTVVDPASLRVELAVQESMYAKVRAAGCAGVRTVSQSRVEPDTLYHFERAAAQADRQRGTVTVYLQPDQPLTAWPTLDGEARVQFFPPNDARCKPQHSMPAALAP